MDEDMGHEVLATQKINMAEKLFEALKQGDISLVEDLLRSGVKVNAILDENLMTPLHYSAKAGNLELYRLLISKRASLRKRDRWKDTVLHYAVRHNQEEIVFEILKGNFSNRLLMLEGKDKDLVLAVALKTGNIKIIKALCEKSNNLEEVNDSVPILPVIKNMDKDIQKEILELMTEKLPKTIFQEMCKYLESEVDSEYKPYVDSVFDSLLQEEKENWLNFFCKSGSTAAVKRVIGESYDYSATCLQEALTYAIEMKHLDIVNVLLSCDIEFNENIFMKCIKFGNVDLLKALVAKMSIRYVPQVIDTNETLKFHDIISISLGIDCQRLLNVAIKKRSVEILEYLLSLGLNFCNKSGRDMSLYFSDIRYKDPLVLAVESEVPEVLDLVLKHGVKCEGGTEEITRKVIKQQNVEMLKVLLTILPSDILKKNKIVVCAVETANIEFIEKLINIGLDLSVGPQSSRTNERYDIQYTTIESPLATAVGIGNLELVNLCCRHKSSICKYGQEINLAIRIKSVDIVSKLLDYKGREIVENILRDVGVTWTPVHEAVKHQNEEMLYKLLSCTYIRENIKQLIEINLNLLTMAFTEANVNILRPLLDLIPNKCPVNDPLQYAIKLENLETLSLLLERNYPIRLETLLKVCQTKNVGIWMKIIEELDDKECLCNDEASLFDSACIANNTELVNLLIQNGVKPSNNFKDGMTVLHIAVAHRNIEMLKACLQLTCIDVNSVYTKSVYQNYSYKAMPVTRYSGSALHIACEMNSLDMASLLLDHKADVNIGNCKGRLPIDAAVEHSNNTLLEIMCRKGGSCNIHLGCDTPLHVATKCRNLRGIQILVSHGASVHAVNHKGESPIFHLVNTIYGKPNPDIVNQIFKFYIEKEAFDRLEDNDGYTLMSRAIMANDFLLINTILESGNLIDIKAQMQEELIIKLIKKNQGTILKKCMEFGFRIPPEKVSLECMFQNYYNDDLTTDEDQLEMVKVLLCAGADVNVRNREGCTLLHKCAKTNWKSMVKLLIDHKCDVNAAVTHDPRRYHTECLGLNALEIALQQKNFIIVKLLIETGMSFDGSTVLQKLAIVQYASPIYRNDEEINAISDIAEAVLKTDIDINKTYVKHGTLLHIATKNNQVALVMKLVSRKCKLDEVVKENGRYFGYTPLQIALTNRYVDIAHILIDHGADTSVVTKSRTLLHLLLESKHHFHEKPMYENSSDSSSGLDSLSEHMLEEFGVSSDNLNTEIDFSQDDNIVKGKTHHKVIDVIEKLLRYQTFINSVQEDGLTALHFAVISNDNKIVKYLISKECNLDIVTSSSCTEFASCTAVSIALKQGYWHIAKVLLDKGCATNLKDKQQQTLLHDVTYCKQGNDWESRRDIVNTLVQQGVPLNEKDKSGKVPLYNAVKCEDENMVNLLLQHQCQVNINWSKKSNCSSLLQASKMHNHAIMKLLLKYGANVSEYDNEHLTALHYTCGSHSKEQYGYEIYNRSTYSSSPCTKGCLEVIKLLLFNGANINAKDQYGNVPLHMASSSGNYDAVKLILSNHKFSLAGTDISAMVLGCFDSRKQNSFLIIKALLQTHKVTFTQDMLLTAVEKCTSNFVRLLLHHGASPDLTDISGNSILHICSSNGQKLDIFRELFYYNANFNLQNKEGETPIHLACKHRHFDAVNLLLYFGAKVDIPDNNGWTCFHLIMKPHVDKECINLIFQQKGNIECKTTNYVAGCKEGLTPMMILLSKRVTDVDIYKIQLMIEKGANLNSTNSSGEHSLLLALRNDSEEPVLTYLIESSASVNLQDKNGWSPLHIAVQHSKYEIIKLLIKYKCNMDSQIKDSEDKYGGQTPIMLAIENIDILVLGLLLEGGSSLFATDVSNRRPVDFCLKVPRKNILEMLVMIIKAGGNVKLINDFKYIKVLSQSEQLVDLLIQSGCRIQCEEILSSDEDQAIADKLMKKQQQPLTLMCIAANAVRTNVRPNALFNVENLPVPRRIRSLIVLGNTNVKLDDVKDSSVILSIFDHAMNMMLINHVQNSLLFQMGWNPFNSVSYYDSDDNDYDDRYYCEWP